MIFGNGIKKLNIKLLEKELSAEPSSFFFYNKKTPKSVVQKKQVQNAFVSKAPSGRELAPKATEGECV